MRTAAESCTRGAAPLTCASGFEFAYPLSKFCCLGALALALQYPRQISPDRGVVGVTSLLLAHAQGATIQRLGLGEATLIAVGVRQIVHAQAQVGRIGRKNGLPNRQSPRE